jgi:stress-induced morphogen
MRLVRRMSTGPVYDLISSALRELKPEFVLLENESHKHNRGDPESHFKVLVVAEIFEGKSVLERHRLVNAAVMKGGPLPCHALTIKALTPAQCPAQATNFVSPNCLGGDKRAAQMHK